LSGFENIRRLIHSPLLIAPSAKRSGIFRVIFLLPARSQTDRITPTPKQNDEFPPPQPEICRFFEKICRNYPKITMDWQKFLPSSKGGSLSRFLAPPTSAVAGHRTGASPIGTNKGALASCPHSLGPWTSYPHSLRPWASCPHSLGPWASCPHRAQNAAKPPDWPSPFHRTLNKKNSWLA